MTNPEQATLASAPVALPRVTIQFCTQCKWMLRAAYFAQELLSTFSTGLGEVALVPGTGGIFIVEITHETSTTTEANGDTTTHWRNQTLWDRKSEGGFPEVKELKKRVRDIIDPSRDLGHVDRASNAASAAINHGPTSSVSASNANPIKPRHENTGRGDDGLVTMPYPSLGNAAASHSPTHTTMSTTLPSRSRSGSNALPSAPASTTLVRVASQRKHARGGSRDLAGSGGGGWPGEVQSQGRDVEDGAGRKRSVAGPEDEDSAAAAAEVRAALGGLGG